MKANRCDSGAAFMVNERLGRRAQQTSHSMIKEHTFAFSRREAPEVCFNSPSLIEEGAGKAGRRLAPAVRAQGNAHGWTTGSAVDIPAFPARMVLTAYVRALPGETSSLATVAARTLVGASHRLA